MLLVITVALASLAALNAIFTAWASLVAKRPLRHRDGLPRLAYHLGGLQVVRITLAA